MQSGDLWSYIMQAGSICNGRDQVPSQIKDLPNIVAHPSKHARNQETSDHHLTRKQLWQDDQPALPLREKNSLAGLQARHAS